MLRTDVRNSDHQSYDNTIMAAHYNAHYNGHNNAHYNGHCWEQTDGLPGELVSPEITSGVTLH
jgi:hypothetical protein